MGELELEPVKAASYLVKRLESKFDTSIRSGLQTLDLNQGSSVTWIPDAADVSQFHFDGFFWLGKDAERTSENLWDPFRDEIYRFLRASTRRLIIVEAFPLGPEETPAWHNAAPPRIKRFSVRNADPLSQQAWHEKYAALSNPSSRVDAEILIDEAFPFAQLYVFTTLPDDLASLPDYISREHTIAMARSASAIAVDIFDGDGVLLWTRKNT